MSSEITQYFQKWTCRILPIIKISYTLYMKLLMFHKLNMFEYVLIIMMLMWNKQIKLYRY